MRSVTRRWRPFLLLPVLAVCALVAWAATPARPRPQALDALRTDVQEGAIVEATMALLERLGDSGR